MFKTTFAAFFIFTTMQSYAAQPSFNEIIVERVKAIVTAQGYQEHVTLNFQDTTLNYIMTYGPTIEDRRAAIAIGKSVFLKCYPTITRK
jgi:hypothetical protein